MPVQIHQVITADVTVASDLTDACKAVDQKLKQLAGDLVEAQHKVEACKVLIQVASSVLAESCCLMFKSTLLYIVNCICRSRG